MSLRGILTAFLVPPAPLVLYALLGLLIERRFRRSGRLLLWLAVLGLLVFAMPITSGTMLTSLEQGIPLTPPADAPAQAIVILGGDISRGGGTGPIVLQVGQLSLERLRAGAELYRRTNLPILVSGGPLHGTTIPLAALMAGSLENDFRVPVRWQESVSRDTWNNAQLSAAILQREGIKSVYVVTQAWHERRALIAFARTGITATAAPTRLGRLPSPDVADFIPDAAGWQYSYFALHEWIGCVYYSLR